MKLQSKTTWIIAYSLFSTLFFFALFLKCYFPMKQGLAGYASTHETPPEPATGRQDLPAPQYRRLVLMVIDALRADFVVGDTEFMPYTRHLLHGGSGSVFLARAHPPTVTLPRIKSITTGSIPGFVDVVMNFGSTVLTEDNFMTQLKQARKTLTFFGDDTWLNLFPDHFTRSDGTTSFFVTDYTEVDNNVTRHLSRELAARDWDVMTLHYLGLDHIGHLAGPTSPLIKPKLLEMDKVVQQIYSAMQSWSASETPSLLVICGDHGMSDQGGHGGSSPGEVMVPVVLLSPHTAFQSQRSYPDIEQIDLCPTLSVLMGLPIPKNNLGCVEVTALPENTSLRDKLRVMQLNAAQLAKMLEQNVEDVSKDHAYQLYEAALHSHEEWLAAANLSSESTKESSGRQVLLAYQDALRRMSQRISKMSTRYDMYGIIVVVAALWMNLFILALMKVNGGNLLQTRTQHVGALTTVCVIVATLGHMTVCTSQYSSEDLCDSSVLSLVLQAFVLLSVITSCLLLVDLIPSTLASKGCSEPLTMLETFLVCATVLHTLSLVSSSFVEEEHQTWYFFTSIIHTLVLVHIIASYAARFAAAVPDGTGSNSSEMLVNDKYGDVIGSEEINSRNTVYTQLKDPSTKRLHKNNEEQRESAENNTSDSTFLKSTVSVFAILCILRVLRRWNQTGNKWLDVPDVGDWLVKPENKTELSVVVGISLACVLLTKGSLLRSWIQRALCACTLTAVYISKAATGAVLLPEALAAVASTQGVAEARLAYFFIMVLLALTLHQLWKDSTSDHTVNQHSTAHSSHSTVSGHSELVEGFQVVWMCVMCLLLRPHNMAFVAMMSLIERLACGYVVSNMKLRPACVLLYCLAMGQASFYMQGNSNSVSTVDVAAGYTALQDYQPGVIGLQMCLSTYAGVIFWLISSLKYIHTIPSPYSEPVFQWLAEAHTDMATTLLLTRALPLAVYTTLVTFMRYHLFVWTVFSPKLLYEGMLTVVCSVFCVIYLCMARFYLRTKVRKGE